MPEGHTVHRIAREFTKRFVGQPVELDSPQGRFAAESALVTGQRMLSAEAHGKQLFIGFANQLSIRVHLGIYGKWRFYDVEKFPSESIGAVRVRFFNQKSMAELRGPTVCEVIDSDAVLAVLNRLGPDPIREDPKSTEQQRFVDRVSRSKVAIGQLLMDQSVIAGVGNVYRAELLFRAGINPHTPGLLLEEEVIRGIWNDSVKLLRAGVRAGVMVTRDELIGKRPNKSERNFVYKRENSVCRNCSSEIKLQMMAGRKLYFCPTCQPT